MKLREYVITALLVAIGFVLHAVTPGFFGMKPDLLITFMILAIMIHPNVKNTLAAGLLGGILAAMTSTFPGGQIANPIDKMMTAFVVLAMVKSLAAIKQDTIRAAIIGFFGTIVSGTVFLGSALLIIGLPAPFSVLFVTVVLPAAAINCVLLGIVYKAAITALKGLQPSRSHS